MGSLVNKWCVHLHDPKHLEAFNHLRNSHVMISQKIVEKAKVLIQSARGLRPLGVEMALNKLVLSELSKAFLSIWA